jgi:hypothetical protein
LEAKGNFVTFDVFSAPFRKGDVVDALVAFLDFDFEDTANEREATVVDGAGALMAGRVSWTVPGVTTFSAADASSATTPRSTDDATRSVNNCGMRLDGVRLDALKIDNLPMQQIWQYRSKTEPTKNQLQPNSLCLIRTVHRIFIAERRRHEMNYGNARPDTNPRADAYSIRRSHNCVPVSVMP